MQNETEKQNPFQIQNTAAIVDISDEDENNEIVVEDEQETNKVD